MTRCIVPRRIIPWLLAVGLVAVADPAAQAADLARQTAPATTRFVAPIESGISTGASRPATRPATATRRVDPPACAGTNQIDNPGFEAATDAVVNGGNAPASPNNWRGKALAAAAVTTTATQINSGGLAASVQASAGKGGGFWYQDVPNLSGKAHDFELCFWVRPVKGNQQVTLVTNWDRGAGKSDPGTRLDFKPTGTTLTTPGGSTALPALKYGEWHRVVVDSDLVGTTAIQVVYFDNVQVGMSAPGNVFPANTATLMAGQGAGTSPDDNEFYYDDFYLAFSQ